MILLKRVRSDGLRAFLIMGLLMVHPNAAAAQDHPVTQVEVHVDGSVARTLDFTRGRTPSAAAEDVMVDVQRRGFLHAALDSIVKAVRPGVFAAYVRPGPPVLLEDFELSGSSVLTLSDVHRHAGIDRGAILDIAQLETGVENLLAELAQRGHVLAEVRIADIELLGEREDRAVVRLEVREGVQALLRTVMLSGAERTNARHGMRVLRLRRGQPIEYFDAADIQRRMLESGLFRSVGEPRMQIAADSVTLIIPVQEEPPGSFDLAFGYQPAEAGASVVGSGHLELINPFGDGRRFMLALDRLPGQVSRLEAEVEDPFLFGSAFRLAGRFGGYQQDSLYHRQQIGIEAGYRFASGIEAFATASRRRARPGTAGLRLQGGRQRIARSDATMIGGGIRFFRLDYARNPGRGIAIEATAERGMNRRSQSRLVDADTTNEQRAVRQDRAALMWRSYVPLGRQGVVVSGVDAHALLSDEFDRSDFIRIGGLRTLRGYDDDRFLVRLAGRGLIEYRHRLDRLSYLAAFVDVAYLERPELHDLEPLAAWRVGFGIGAQFDTGFSLMNVAFAANPTDGLTSPRIHAGISFGL